MLFRHFRLVQYRFLIPAAVLFLLSGFGNPALSQVSFYDQTLNVVSFGGAYTRSQMLAYVRPWEASTGKAINMIDFGGGLAEIRDQVNSANVKWDVVDLELADVITGCNEGLLESVDSSLIAPGADGTPAADDIPQDYMQDCGYPSIVWATVLGYDERAFPGDKPSTVADFFNVDDFPGKRGLRRSPRGLLEWVLISSGIPLGDIYTELSTPEGVEYAFNVATPMKPHITWWTSFNEPAKLLTSGAVTMSSAGNGRFHEARYEQDQPVTIIWDGQLQEVEYWVIPKGTPRMANARNFIEFALMSENMANQSKYITYGPVRKSSQVFVSEDIRPHLPTSNMSNALRVDSAWWAENMSDLNGKFEEWLKPAANELDRNVRF